MNGFVQLSLRDVQRVRQQAAEASTEMPAAGALAGILAGVLLVPEDVELVALRRLQRQPGVGVLIEVALIEPARSGPHV